MKVNGKDLFTVESVTKPDKVLKPEVKEAIKDIIMIMFVYDIDKVEL